MASLQKSVLRRQRSSESGKSGLILSHHQPSMSEGEETDEARVQRIFSSSESDPTVCLSSLTFSQILESARQSNDRHLSVTLSEDIQPILCSDPDNPDNSAIGSSSISGSRDARYSAKSSTASSSQHLLRRLQQPVSVDPARSTSLGANCPRTLLDCPQIIASTTSASLTPIHQVFVENNSTSTSQFTSLSNHSLPIVQLIDGSQLILPKQQQQQPPHQSSSSSSLSDFSDTEVAPDDCEHFHSLPTKFNWVRVGSASIVESNSANTSTAAVKERRVNSVEVQDCEINYSVFSYTAVIAIIVFSVVFYYVISYING